MTGKQSRGILWSKKCFFAAQGTSVLTATECEIKKSLLTTATAASYHLLRGFVSFVTLLRRLAQCLSD